MKIIRGSSNLQGRRIPRPCFAMHRTLEPDPSHGDEDTFFKQMDADALTSSERAARILIFTRDKYSKVLAGL